MSKMTKVEEIKLVSRYLGNLALLRSLSKQVDFSAIESAINNLQTVLAERQEEAELERIEREEFESRRQAMLAKLQEEGWSLEALINGIDVKSTKSKKGKAPNKYRYTNSEGKECFWSGFGRMPSDLKSLVDSGNSLESYLISN